MDNEKMIINLAPGMEKAEITVREGEAIKVPDVLAPLKVNINGTLGAVVEYLSKRVGVGEFSQTVSHILVDREKMCITLVTHESDAYLRREISGKLEMHPKFVEFGINSSTVWTPSELGMFIKMNRAYFPSREENMKLVSILMNFVASVNNKVEKSLKENGDRTDNFSQVVNSNLPSSFIIEIPVFKGFSPMALEVETFAKVSGREVSFVLLSPGAAEQVEFIRNQAIDHELIEIRELAPEIAIIEV